MSMHGGPRNPRFLKDMARGYLVTGLLLLFGVTIALAFTTVGSERWPDAKTWISVVLPVEAGLLTIALRFYFGGRAGE